MRKGTLRNPALCDLCSAPSSQTQKCSDGDMCIATRVVVADVFSFSEQVFFDDIFFGLVLVWISYVVCCLRYVRGSAAVQFRMFVDVGSMVEGAACMRFEPLELEFWGIGLVVWATTLPPSR